MKTILLLAAIGLSLLLVGCASGTKNDATQEPEDTAETDPKRPPAAIAPGTAKATALVLGYEERDHHYLSTLKIEQVDGYGAGTPALPVGTEIVVVVPKALFDEDPDGAKASAMLATDHTVAVTLKHLTSATVGDEPPSPSWRALAIR